MTAHCRRQWHPTPVLLPGKSHGRRSLEGCSPWGRWGSGTTERLHFHFSLSRIGEGNGIPLQCSCLENPRDGGAWWAAVYRIAQSQTRLKWLSSSSSPKLVINEIFTKGWMKNQTVIYPYNWTLCCCCSVMQSCSTLCEPMDCSTPGCPVLHHLPELAQTHVHWFNDAIQPSNQMPSNQKDALLLPSPPSLNISQYQGLYPNTN